MKKFCKTLCVAIVATFALSTSYAQNMEQATETFNNAVAALNENRNNDALTGFERAMEMAAAAGEEGVSMVNDCKGVIPGILLKMGKTAANEQNIDDAVARLNDAIARAQEYGNAEVAAEAKELIPVVMLAAGNTLFNEKKYAEALVEFQKVLAKDPDNGMAYLRVGMTQNRLGNMDAAVEALQKAMTLGQEENAKGQLLSVYANAAVAAYKSKNNAGAFENAQKAAEYGDNPQVFQIGGIAAFNLKRYDESIALLSKAKPGSSINYYLARAYEGKGDSAKACEYYKKIVNDSNFGEFAKSKVSTLCK